MAQQLSTSFIQTNIPGSYFQETVVSTPIGFGSSGNIVIMGEAAGGPSYKEIALKGNSFSPSQLAQVRQTYISGPIVDAFTAFTAPSDDPNITSTANLIYIIKTNTGSQASSLLPLSYGNFIDQNYGVNGNLYKYQITSLAEEVAPSVQGSTVPAFGAPLNGVTFNVRQLGGTSVAVALSGTTGAHANIADLIIELNTVLPVGLTASLGIATNSLEISMASDANPYADGYGQSFELIDTVPGDLAALGLIPNIYVSSQEPEVEVNIVRSDINLNELFSANAEIALQIGYQGTTALLTINQAAATFVTTVAGGIGASLSINLNQYTTISELGAFIASQPGYSAVVNPSANQLPPSSLDDVASLGIASTIAAGLPGRIKIANYNFIQSVGSSTALSFVSLASAGLPSPMALFAFLSGGLLGPTLAVDIINAIDQMAGITINMIVPLFSQNASADIAAGNTDPASTYTIAAINAAVKSHCLEYSSPALKRNRIAFLSQNDTYANIAAAAQTIATYRCSFSFQQAMQVNSVGVITTFLPWYTACIAAGMQAGGFYKSICNKVANIINFIDPAGFDSGNPGDVEAALNAGLLFLYSTAAGSVWVSDQTTYGIDSNFVYNSIQAVYDSDIIGLDLSQSFQTAFVGQSLADVSAASALTYLSQKMAQYKQLKLIGSSTDAPLGFKNASITINAPTMTVAVEIKLATAIYFIPISISISAIQQSAS